MDQHRYDMDQAQVRDILEGLQQSSMDNCLDPNGISHEAEAELVIYVPLEGIHTNWDYRGFGVKCFLFMDKEKHTLRQIIPPLQWREGDEVVLCEDFLYGMPFGLVFRVDGTFDMPEDWDWWSASEMDPADARLVGTVRKVEAVQKCIHPDCTVKDACYLDCHKREWFEKITLDVRKREVS